MGFTATRSKYVLAELRSYCSEHRILTEFLEVHARRELREKYIAIDKGLNLYKMKSIDKSTASIE
jgi:hypothetical protein